jgi:tellurite resistance protein TerC
VHGVGGSEAAVAAWAWWVFGASLAVMLAVDLLVHRGGRHEGRRSAVAWAIVWIAAGLGFGGFVWWVGGSETAQEYFAAYLIEKALSVDNLFVFLVVFQALGVPPQHQRTGLTWGIFGALLFRAIFIFVGAAALERWHWLEFLFAAILIAAAVHAYREGVGNGGESRIIAWLSRRVPIAKESARPRLVVRRDGKLTATPLLIAVLAIEATDVMFAIDSVPAALAVTRDRFVVYSSNAFAILGLRSLYIVLAAAIRDLKYLNRGLAGILVFAGLKMASSRWVEVPPLASIAIIAAIMGAAVAASLMRLREAKRPRETMARALGRRARAQ